MEWGKIESSQGRGKSTGEGTGRLAAHTIQAEKKARPLREKGENKRTGRMRIETRAPEQKKKISLGGKEKLNIGQDTWGIVANCR